MLDAFDILPGLLSRRCDCRAAKTESGVPSVPRAMRDEELRLAAQEVADVVAMRDAKVGYFVNLDERGSFYADVRTFDEKTLFEVRGGNELSEDESSLVDDGFMSSRRDIDGLQSYLRSLILIACSCCVIPRAAEDICYFLRTIAALFHFDALSARREPTEN